MNYANNVVLKKSLRLWWVLPIAVLLAIRDWHAHTTGTWTHRRGYGSGVVMLPIALGMVIYDIYTRFIRQDRLEFSEIGILDLASSDRLGQIRWEAVETLTVRPSLLGAEVTIGFKDGAPLNDHVEQWDNLRFGALAISEDERKRILHMADERKIETAIVP